MRQGRGPRLVITLGVIGVIGAVAVDVAVSPISGWVSGRQADYTAYRAGTAYAAELANRVDGVTYGGETPCQSSTGIGSVEVIVKAADDAEVRQRADLIESTVRADGWAKTSVDRSDSGDGFWGEMDLGGQRADINIDTSFRPGNKGVSVRIASGESAHCVFGMF